ncbi:MAG: single-stranded-DNA-specific exonuclease RecJ [Verrucomicrobia bacterium]|nr:single-stranded-DNA-specific exonuclease RecJ [Verrucomicrobiota bacterium]MBS0636462.1 single-stranded-DNA-specific exonuclease RecJ [Verrucomicrobiota bacterium]
MDEKTTKEAGQLLWVYPKKDPALLEKIIQEFHLHPVLAQVLASRGITSFQDIHQYLYAKLPDLHDPFLFAEMPKAVKRIEQAIKNEENILVYGDNDVDGMTGTALLSEMLNFVGAKVFHYISNRTTLLRQSMILDALEYALKTHCTLLITVDCGITAAEQIEEVVRHKIDVIITDHHEPTDKIPLCVATLNPKLLSSEYPNRELTGVGVAFKLACALTEHLIDEGMLTSKKVDLKRYLDLVAIGTVSDMGLLLGENRILVSYGLDQLRKTKRIGVAKLLSICETDLLDTTTSIIASKIAPRLNSLGRIAEPEQGVKLLLAKQALAAEKLAIELNLYNIERQKIERQMSKEVEKMLESNPSILDNKAIVLTSRKWHPGIIAILAMRISKQYNRPTVMIALDGQVGKGSVRSIPEFPVLGPLKKLSDLLINFGGHDSAAGLSIRESCIESFAARFIEIANESLHDLHITPKLHLDACVRFDDLTFDLIESLKLLEPYGHGNPTPLLYADCTQIQEPKMIGKQHLKLYLEQEDRMLEGIAIGQAHRLHDLQKKDLTLRVAFTPQVNGSSIQLLIRDFQI